MAKIRFYKKSSITPETRLSDLVTRKYHHQLKLMIDELRQLTTIEPATEWWQVKRLDFKKLRKSNNYVPIARFVKQIPEKENEALKCSVNTLFYYIASKEHSNLSIKWDSLKTLVYNMINYEYV